MSGTVWLMCVSIKRQGAQKTEARSGTKQRSTEFIFWAMITLIDLSIKNVMIALSSFAQ